MAEKPDGWGFCDNRDCQCWKSSEVGPCDEWKEFDPHPFERCAQCGIVKSEHGDVP